MEKPPNWVEDIGKQKIHKMKILFLILLLSLSTTSCAQTQSSATENARKERTYKIQKIDSTTRFYIVNAHIQKKPVLLVIDKNSNQLKNRELKKYHTYTFSTYRFYDIVAPSGVICHEVDHREIWCEGDKEALHFTDGMGNVYSK